MDLPKHLTIIEAALPCWKVVSVRYFDANLPEGDPNRGNLSANIYVRAKHADGTPAVGLLVWQTWPDGGNAPKELEYRNQFQIDGDTDEYAGCDFFMSRDGYRQAYGSPGPYSIYVPTAPSDVISGMGLAPNRAHDVYRIEFRWVEAGAPPTKPPEPPPSGNYVTREELEAELRGLRNLVGQAFALAGEKVLNG